MDKTLVKGLHVLEALVHSTTARGVSDLAREVQLTKSNTHRTIKTLVSRGYVKQDKRTGEYTCTLKLFELAAAVMASIDIRPVADPVMRSLAAKTQETVHLAVLDDLDIICLHKIDGPQPVRAYSVVGGRAPAYCVATGKALLAHETDEYVKRLGSKLHAYTPRTLASLDALLRELRQIRRQGFAINRGEWRESVCGLAATVFDASRRPVASLGVSGPIARLRPAVLRAFADDVLTAARTISRALGYRPLPVALRPVTAPRNGAF